MAEFILLNRAILNANGDFKLAIKNIDNIPDGNLPTPTRNLLNEFKSALKDIEQVVKTQEPTPAKAINEPNPTQNSIKGDGFVTYPQTATQKYPYNAFLDIEKDLATQLNLPQAQIRASLQYLWDNHANDGMFKNKSDIYKTIKMLIGYQDYAGNSFKNPDMAYIATKTSDNKMSDMAINRDSGGVIHLNKDKKMSQTDRQNLDKKPMAETPKSQRKQQVPGVQMNTSKEHFSSANAKTIPNQSIKQAETTAKTAEPTANLAQNAMKGDGFVISGNAVEPKSDLSVKISVDEWVKELAGINPNKQIIADLEHLYEKHKELFSKPSEVFKLIKAVKDNPTFFYTNNQPNIALIGSILENGKLGKIGIQKDFNSDNLQVRHATYSSNAKKENERLLKRNSYPVGSPTPTQLTFGKTAEPTANGAKALLGKEDGAIAGTPAPATTRPNNGVEGEIIKNRTNAKTIPNQSIKQAETTAKTAEPKTAENTQGNSKILTNQDIKEQISKWDLNAPKQTLITNKIDGEELEKLNEHFKFKGNYPLTRQIDSEHIKHALNHHGDEKTEALRGQKAITLDDISNYENYAKTADIKEYSDKKVISKKQINGHFVVVEEALTGKNRLNFVSMWYVKGKIKDVAPVSTPKNDLDRTLSNRYDSSNSTPKEIKSQEPTPQAKAQTTATQPTSQVKEPTDNRKYFKNLDKEQYEQVVYDTDIGRSRLYNISSLSTSANIWAQDFSDEYLMAKYNATKDEVAKARAKWQDILIENGIDTAPIKEFGINYVEFYHAKDLAIKKLLTERQGQVAGAFHKDGRDITISWGEAKMANGDIKGYGLSKIEAKHLDDFAIFEGSTPQEKMANGINEIIEKGKIVSDNGIDTIWYKKGDSYFLVGLSKGFKGVGDDSWVVTSYKKNKYKRK
ncbi:hypothetical protein [Campylobacter lanienae]|uniref:putative barnase/colicin E5 family endoribonuclease n=1 Tax=Campylobacter lanienae TaxID=75658 RepID=UPI003F0907FF